MNVIYNCAVLIAYTIVGCICLIGVGTAVCKVREEWRKGGK